MADEKTELTEVQIILDGLSSPTDEEFVQAVRAYSDGAVASAAALLAMAGGGGGSLPDWWTVDSTPGSESVTFDGQVVINGADPLTNGSNLIIKAGPGSSDNDTDIIYIKDEFGNLVVSFSANGGFRMQERNAGEDGLQMIAATGDRIDVGGGSNQLTFTSTGTMYLHANNIQVFTLPTADPVVVGQLWNSSGTVKVSAG